MGGNTSVFSLFMVLICARLLACGTTDLIGVPDSFSDAPSDAPAESGTDPAVEPALDPDASVDAAVDEMPDEVVCGNGVIEDGEECDDGNEDDWDGCSGCTIVEFLVNAHIDSRQTMADATVLSDGTIVFVWSGATEHDPEFGIAGRLFASNGQPETEDININTRTDDIQGEPSVAGRDDGSFVVAWDSWRQDGDRCGVFGQLFNEDGLHLGTEFQVNSFTESNQSEVDLAVSRSGHFTAVWQSDGVDGDYFGVAGQMFDYSASVVGSEYVINTYVVEGQGNPSLSMTPDGRSIVVWSSRDQDGDGMGIFGRLFHGDGIHAGEEFQVNTLTQAWQVFPDVAMNEDGAFVVVWADQAHDIFGRQDISAQIFNSDGTRRGHQFLVNDETSYFLNSPSVTFTDDDEIIVTWTATLDGLEADVFCKTLDEFGSPTGPEIVVNETTISDAFPPHVSSLPDGRFVIAWASRTKDGQGDIFAQRFDATGNPLGTLPW